VSAATVEATVVELAGEFDVLPATAPAAAAAAVFCAEAALDALKMLYRAEVWLLSTLPIDLMTSIATARTGAIGRGCEELEEGPSLRQ
jgi:hypothetical protein